MTHPPSGQGTTPLPYDAADLAMQIIGAASGNDITQRDDLEGRRALVRQIADEITHGPHTAQVVAILAGTTATILAILARRAQTDTAAIMRQIRAAIELERSNGIGPAE
jgi:hypothetical protein